MNKISLCKINIWNSRYVISYGKAKRIGVDRGEKRGLFLFFLPPYSPHLNIAETLWRILKGKWIRPQDYASTDMLFYATNRAVADIGNGLNIKFLKHTA